MWKRESASRLIGRRGGAAPQRGRGWLLVPALLLWQWLAGGAAAQEPPSSVGEYTVKAAFLYNFTRYIKWPENAFESSDSPFVIGVLGEAPPELSQALVYYQENKKAHDRPIVVRYLNEIQEATQCHVVFVRNSLDDEHVSEIIQHCGQFPVLLVGETDTFLQQGGGISFTMSDQKVGFRLAVKSTTSKDLKLDAKLLRVAELVD
jgi:hypothetical protein